MVRFTPPLAKLMTLALNTQLHREGVVPPATLSATGGISAGPMAASADPYSMVRGPTGYRASARPVLKEATAKAGVEEAKAKEVPRQRKRDRLARLFGGGSREKRAPAPSGLFGRADPEQVKSNDYELFAVRTILDDPMELDVAPASKNKPVAEKKKKKTQEPESYDFAKRTVFSDPLELEEEQSVDRVHEEQKEVAGKTAQQKLQEPENFDFAQRTVFTDARQAEQKEASVNAAATAWRRARSLATSAREEEDDEGEYEDEEEEPEEEGEEEEEQDEVAAAVGVAEAEPEPPRVTRRSRIARFFGARGEPEEAAGAELEETAPAEEAYEYGIRTAADHHVPPEDALRSLEEGNERFMHGTSGVVNTFGRKQRESLAKQGQNPMAAILGSADSRAPVEQLFDAMPGDLFVVRNAGSTLSDAEGSVVGALEYSTGILGAKLIIVLGHSTDAVMWSATKVALNWESPLINPQTGLERTGLERMMQTLQPVVQQARRDVGTDDPVQISRRAIYINAFAQIEVLLRASPAIREQVRNGEVQIHAAFHDCETGKVHFVGQHPRLAGILGIESADQEVDLGSADEEVSA